MDENVVDFRPEGKNKVFFLKRTIEARRAVVCAELQRQSRVLKEYPLLRGIFIAIQASPDIQLAILYGSYAKGLAHADSDIDVFIETDSAEIKGRIEARSPLLSVNVGRFDKEDLMVREIVKEHVIIKGIETYLDRIDFLRS